MTKSAIIKSGQNHDEAGLDGERAEEGEGWSDMMQDSFMLSEEKR
jgi:hypothetical protein